MNASTVAFFTFLDAKRLSLKVQPDIVRTGNPQYHNIEGNTILLSPKYMTQTPIAMVHNNSSWEMNKIMQGDLETKGGTLIDAARTVATTNALRIDSDSLSPFEISNATRTAFAIT